MKKIFSLGIAAILALLAFTSCTQKTSAPKAGSAELESMLNLIPKNVQGVILVDLHKVMTMSFVDKAIKEDKNYQKYQDFIKETGIDPQKDISFLAVGIGGEKESKKQNGALIACLKYDKNVLLAKMKKESPDIKEETYNGMAVYGSIKGEKGKPASGAFLDDSNIVLGTDDMVKAVIDVYQKKAESVLKNEALASIIKTANKNAIAWSAFAIPADAAKQMSSQNPMLAGLEGITAVTMFFDYKDKTFSLEIKTGGGEEAKNKQIADMLTGFKAMGAGASAKNPDLGDLLNRIEVSSGADFIRIYAGLPEELIERLSKSAAQKVEGMIQPKEQPEEMPEEE